MILLSPVLSPRRRAQARRAAPAVILILGIAAFDHRFHEFWRDEIGVVIAMRAVTWRGLNQAMRYEGVPPFFHVIVKILTTVLSGPLTLMVAGMLGLAVLLFGTYRLLVSISGAPRASARATFVFGLTYVYAWELGAMVRQYALGLGLALLSFSYLRDALRRGGGRRTVLLGTITAGLAALTSVHAACVAGAGLLAFGVLSLLRRRRPRAWWLVLLTLPCFGYVLYLAMPFADRVAAANDTLHFTKVGMGRLALQALVEGVMPADWFAVDTFGPSWLFQGFAVLRSLGFWGLLAGGTLALLARLRRLWSRRGVETFDLIAGTAGIIPLLEIFIHHYWGFFRHHLFLGMPLVVIVTGWGLDRRLVGPLAFEVRRLGLVFLAPWFVFQALLAAGNFTLDVPCTFSDTKMGSTVLSPGAHVVAETEWRSMGLLFWRPDIELRAAGAWGGKPFRYGLFDVSWHRSTPLPPLVVEECRAVPDRVFFSGGKGGLGALARCAQQVEFERRTCGEHPLVWENFEMFKMDCACVNPPPPPPPTR